MFPPGTRIGPYEVVSPLGSGGMGVVYRARDTVLRREVALKTLPEAVALDPERLALLRREARTRASLNHPGIATLYGLEELEGTPVLAMEVVEGETLADRVARSALPLKDVLRIGQQVAEATAAAHESGVLHRDLKPANVRLTKDGRAKVLDFGLALPPGTRESALDSREPTHTSPPGHEGSAAGTVPYMSPEQTRGEAVDARADVWAFGCVLYEMLTGKRAFKGATPSETAAVILERAPDLGALPETTPFVLQRLLRRWLRRDKEERLHDIADAALELRELLAEISSGAPVAGFESRACARRAAAVAPAGCPCGLARRRRRRIGVLLSRGRRSAATSELRQPRFEATLPRGVVLIQVGSPQNPLAFSPDGQRLAFVGCSSGACRIYLRDRREIDARPLPGGEERVLSPIRPRRPVDRLRLERQAEEGRARRWRLLVSARTKSEPRLLAVMADSSGPPEELHVGEAQVVAPAPHERALLFLRSGRARAVGHLAVAPRGSAEGRAIPRDTGHSRSAPASRPTAASWPIVRTSRDGPRSTYVPIPARARDTWCRSMRGTSRSGRAMDERSSSSREAR